MKVLVLWNVGSSQQGYYEFLTLFWCQNFYIYCLEEMRNLSPIKQNKRKTLTT